MIRRLLVNEQGRNERLGDLAWAEACHARCLGMLREREAAFVQTARAGLVLKVEAERIARADLGAAVRSVASIIAELAHDAKD
jgi:hypothetical protein